MQGKNGKTREIWGREFTLVRHGLDEQEVFSFVRGLIDRNNEYAEKLDHLDSLVKLGENTIIEADEEAERIRAHAQGIAEEEARATVLRAEEDARARAERILADAEEEAALKADRIIAEADETAREKLAAAQELAQNIVKSAEDEARQQMKAIRDQTAAQVQAARQRARELLSKSRTVAVNEITAKFEAAYQDTVAGWVASDTHTGGDPAPDTAQPVDESPTDASATTTQPPAQTARIGRSIRRALPGGKKA